MSQQQQKDDLSVIPKVAIWTIVLFLACASSYVAILTFTIKGTIPYAAGLLGLYICSYLLFTPMHDSAHKSIARNRFLNDLIGRLSALAALAPFHAFRYCHLEHHKHTNDEKKDPDMWSGRGTSFLTGLLHWCTQDLYYYSFYFPLLKNRSKSEILEVLATVIVIYSFLISLLILGHYEIFFLIVLPSRMAVTTLAFAFDYLPHHPHKVLSSEDRFKATVNFKEKWLSPFLVYQNYHLMHHLSPAVPFYLYKKAWKAKEASLVEKGAQVKSVFTAFERS